MEKLRINAALRLFFLVAGSVIWLDIWPPDSG
jgi:hypothetical protein